MIKVEDYIKAVEEDDFLYIVNYPEAFKLKAKNLAIRYTDKQWSCFSVISSIGTTIVSYKFDVIFNNQQEAARYLISEIKKKYNVQ